MAAPITRSRRTELPRGFLAHEVRALYACRCQHWLLKTVGEALKPLVSCPALLPEVRGHFLVFRRQITLRFRGRRQFGDDLLAVLRLRGLPGLAAGSGVDPGQFSMRGGELLERPRLRQISTRDRLMVGWCSLFAICTPSCISQGA